MKLSVIIPNYNGIDLLRKNLPKVINEISSEQGDQFECIIIDDSSTDGSVNFLRSFKEKNKGITIIENSKNLGFSKSVNKAVRECSSEIFLLLNTDVSPEHGFLPPLLSHFKNPDIFAVGCLDKSLENGKIVKRGRGVGKWRRGFMQHSAGKVDLTDTLWVSGGSSAFRKDVWDKLGGFNELYSPFYWEDIDISYRALKSGFKIVFEPKSIVVHEHENGSILSAYSSSRIKSVAYRNQILFVWENATDFDIIISHIVWMPYHLLKALVNLDFNFCVGFFKAIILIPKAIKKRKLNKKLFILKDGVVIENIK